MLLKKTLTAVAVDSARDYLQDRLTELKKLDLDKNGVKDVDQVAELLGQIGEKLKDSIESTDFQKLGSGIEQLMNGAGLISESIDRQKLGAACEDIGNGLKQLGKLLRLGVAEMKEHEKN